MIKQYFVFFVILFFSIQKSSLTEIYDNNNSTENSDYNNSTEIFYYNKCFFSTVNLNLISKVPINIFRPRDILIYDFASNASFWARNDIFFKEACRTQQKTLECFEEERDKSVPLSEEFNFTLVFSKHTCLNIQDYKNYSQCMSKYYDPNNLKLLIPCLFKYLTYIDFPYNCSGFEDWENELKCLSGVLGEVAGECGSQEEHFKKLYYVDYKLHLLGCRGDPTTKSILTTIPILSSTPILATTNKTNNSSFCSSFNFFFLFCLYWNILVFLN